MLPAEGLNDITEDPSSEIGEETFFEDDDTEETQVSGGETSVDHRLTEDTKSVSRQAQSPFAKSIASSARSDGRRIRLNQPREPVQNYTNVSLKRDPAIESIIENRKFTIVENPYTRLAISTSQAPRASTRSNPFETLNLSSDPDYEPKERALTGHSRRRLTPVSTTQLDSQEWDDGLSVELDKESTVSRDKSCLQLYEEICARLNVCPCAFIVRYLNTSEINLRNYGLGPRGCLTLAAALVRNTTVTTLNLSGNHIGNSGMSHIYQILTENTYIEEYDLSFNNLGTKGIVKLADAMPNCLQIKTLNVAGNDLTANDIKILLSKLEDHSSLKTLNISHNPLDEEGGIFVAKWLGDNSTLIDLDISWCSIRLKGAEELAKGIGRNNKLVQLDASYNSFTNDNLNSLTQSLSGSMTLSEFNLQGNKFISRYDAAVKENPSVLTTGKDCMVYKLISSAACNQSLKIFRLGRNHLDIRCLIIMLEALAQLPNITLEEFDLTGLTINSEQTAKVNALFLNHPNMTCYVGPVRQTIDHFVNHLLDLINNFCDENQINVGELFHQNEGTRSASSTITYEQFLEGLRKAKIPFPSARINDIMKYLSRDGEPGSIFIRSLTIA